MRKGHANRCISACLVVFGGCVVATENVTHEGRGVGYPGYQIEYVAATPAPGTLLSPGVPTPFEVTVRYTLQSAEKGRIVLMFRREREIELLPSREVAVAIARGQTETTTLSQELIIPPGVEELTLRIPVLPEGVKDPVGALRLRYPVSRVK